MVIQMQILIKEEETMKKIIFRTLAVLAAFGLLSCEKTGTRPSGSEPADEVVFSASTEGTATRTELSDNGDDTYTVLWTAGDAINVNGYNLSLQTAPLTLTRQCAGKCEFEIIWPERTGFFMDHHDSFFLRDGDRLFFNRWHEEGEGAGYRYWEETVVKDLSGEVIEILPGDVMRMPDGEIWHMR